MKWEIGEMVISNIQNENTTKPGYQATKTVLIIKNDESSTFLLTECFGDSRINFIETHAHQALNFSLNWQFDLSIVDISRREMLSGLELIKEMRKAHKDKPIIAYSASVYPHEKEACFLAGCNAFIPKPFEFEYLTEVVNSFL